MCIKRLATAAIAICLSVAAAAKTPDNVKYSFTEASDLTLVGKLFSDIPNPYHRVDTVRFKGFTKDENLQVRESSGLACAFRTNSTVISVQTTYGTAVFPDNTGGMAARGYDLYIKENDKWIYAATAVAPSDNLGSNKVIIRDMKDGMKECLLYLPLYSEVNSVRIGVQEGAVLEAAEKPFRHRVAIWGSSYTHGSCTSRPGLTYPAQFTRATGIQLLSLGCSGNCRLQDYFCDVLCEAEDIDAFIFDAFSNPSARIIRRDLFPFIEKLQAAHPGKPLIFQQTIRRENRNFDLASDAYESAKMAMADSLMKIAAKKYPDVYYIYPQASTKDHEGSVDATHPTNYGYTLWEKSIEKPVLRILRKYGIR